MPRPPINPFDRFLDNLAESFQDAAEEFLEGVNDQLRESIRQQSTRMNQAESDMRQRASVRRERAKARRAKEKVHVPGHDRQITAYDVLEVSPKASAETISAAFRSLSARYHPDNKKTGNEERYKAISAAWMILKDPERRKKYDKNIGVQSGS